MATDERFARVLEKIYAATLSDAFWPDALREVGGLFGSSFAHFEVLDKATGQPVYFRNEGASDAALQDYVAHYASVSPRAAQGSTLPAGAVSFDYDILTEAQMDRDEFYADFMRPQGYRYFISANLINSRRTFGVFSVQRRIEQGHASEEEIEMMRRLAPHLSQAVRIRLRLAAENAADNDGDLLFARSATGIVFLDASGSVYVFRNRSFAEAVEKELEENRDDYAGRDRGHAGAGAVSGRILSHRDRANARRQDPGGRHRRTRRPRLRRGQGRLSRLAARRTVDRTGIDTGRRRDTDGFELHDQQQHRGAGRRYRKRGRDGHGHRLDDQR